LIECRSHKTSANNGPNLAGHSSPSSSPASVENVPKRAWMICMDEMI
ncbi:7386_t:CDS:2, partial [Acaulospora colombiana]